VDPAQVKLCEPYLRSAAIAAYFDDLQRADLIARGEAGWLLSRSLDSTDLLRVYNNTHYRLPLRPAEEAAALGIELPARLLELLDVMADTLHAALGTRLDQIYPQDADAPADAPAIEEPNA
jgi:membrane protein